MVTVVELQAQIDSLMAQLETLQSQVVSSHQTVKETTREDVNAVEERLKILPDSSWLIALLDNNDTHHTAVSASFGALLPYKPVFYIPAIVYLETISHLTRVNKISVKKAHDMIEKVLMKLNYKHSQSLKIQDIVAKYRIFSRIKIKKLRPLDFYIVTEGISLDTRILTCDLDMYITTRKYYKKIYFLTDKLDKKESDLGSLITDIQSEKP